VRPPETFATERLRARKPRVSDAPAVFAAYASDPIATRFLSWKAYRELAPLEEFLRERVKDWEQDHQRYGYLLCLRDTDTPIGSIALDLSGGKALFGYVLGRAHWGRGLMAEALGHLVNWSLAQPEIFRAWAFCDVENPASVRVMEKAGMTREGVLRRWHVCPTVGPEPRDCIVCAKAK
jgi:ribosomal-protein-alanine N-acetyltransferase